MADQKALQQFIQRQAGTQTAAQSNVPSSVNNGNPGTVYNTSALPVGPTWGTYVPTTTPAQPGGLPSTVFDLVQAPYVPSSPGYVSPFTADPTVAMVLSQMPQAQGNDLINRLIGNMSRPRPQAPVTPTLPTIPTLPPVAPPPTTTPPTRPPVRPPGSGPRPIGPISGPVDEWLRSPRPGRPPDVTAPTNLDQMGLGRTQALDWLRNNYGAFDPTTGAMDASSPAFQSISNVLSQIGGAIGGALREAWNDATGQNGAMSAAGFWASLLSGTPGLGELAEILQSATNSTQPFQLSDETLARLERTQVSEFQEALDSVTNTANNVTIRPDGQQGGLESWYSNQGQYTPQEWQQVQESIAWNNFWNGGAPLTPEAAHSGTRRPTLGLPSMDLIDQMINNMNQQALDWSLFFQNMAGRRER